MMRHLVLALALLAPLAVTTSARADVPPPDTEGCTMKSAGDPCKADDGSDHTCLQQKCSKTLPDGDGGTTTTEYDCLLCNGPAGGSGSSGSSGSSGAGAGDSNSSGGSNEDDGGCAFSNHPATGVAGAWALGAAVLLLGRRFKGASRRSRRS